MTDPYRRGQEGFKAQQLTNEDRVRQALKYSDWQFRNPLNHKTSDIDMVHFVPVLDYQQVIPIGIVEITVCQSEIYKFTAYLNEIKRQGRQRPSCLLAKSIANAIGAPAYHVIADGQTENFYVRDMLSTKEDDYVAEDYKHYSSSGYRGFLNKLKRR